MAEAPTVFIAGATSAIAQATARLLAERGASFFLVARDPRKLDAVAADLRARGSARVESAVADLDALEGHGALVEEASARLGAIDIALIAHGILPDQRQCEADFTRTLAALNTNFVSAASLAAELGNRFEKRGRGTIAVIGSVAGDRGRQSNYVYGAAKGGLALFLQGLRHRLHPRGVNVVTVKPGLVDTPMTRDFTKGALWATPERVAEGIVRAIDRGAHEVYLPGFWRLIMAVVRGLPERIFFRTRL
jgi:decaprenylphospho-beta-D-erythro-pentofuranosid-2-ulose 2-reductase